MDRRAFIGTLGGLARPGGNMTGISRVFDEGLIGKALQLHPLTLRCREAVVKHAAANRIPAVYEFAEFARAGGLLAYSASLPALFARAAIYVDKILKGARPADLPVEQPTKFELVINLKTAKALGLTIPQSVLLRADEVIR